MKRIILRSAIVLAVLLAAAQFIRPSLAGVPSDPARAIQAAPAMPNGLAAVLDRSCGDCHSNRAVAPGWHTRIAPASWVMAQAVHKGREVVNFSEWAGYPVETQRALLSRSCAAAKANTMPGSYAYIRSDVRLSAQDVDTICAAANVMSASAAVVR